MLHGRLVLAGVPGGADGIDCFDAACVALADQYEEWETTEFTRNPKGGAALLKGYQLTRDPEGPAASVDPAAEMAAMRAEMAARPPKNPDEAE